LFAKHVERIILSLLQKLRQSLKSAVIRVSFCLSTARLADGIRLASLHPITRFFRLPR